MGVAVQRAAAEVKMHDDAPMLKVAGLAVRLHVDDLPARQRLALHTRYGDFLRPGAAGGAPVAVLTMQEVAGPDFLPWEEQAALPLRVWLAGERLWVRSPWEYGWLDLLGGMGSVTLRPRGAPENFLRVIFGWLCVQRGGLLLHACGLCRDTRGYLFVGPSGAGKSTVATLAAGATVLSDDLVIVRPVRGRYRVYGTPFHGSASTAPRCDSSAPLTGIYFLVQAPDHAALPLDGAAALAQMTAAAPFVTTLPAGAALTLGVCARLIGQVAPQALHFRPDPGFWEVIHV